MRAAAAVLAAALALACGEQGRFGGTTGPGGGGGGGGGAGTGPEINPPTVQILQPTAANFPVGVGDSVFIQVRVQDDRGVVKVDLIGVASRGQASLGTDTTVQRFLPKTVTLPGPFADTTLTRYLLAAPGDSSSEFARVIVAATDSSGKVGLDTATIRITSGPRLTLSRPTNGSAASVGRDITIEVRAIDPQGVRVVGWSTSGVLTQTASITQPIGSGSLPDTVVFVDTLTIPAGTATGALNITAFATDSIGDPSGTVTPVVVNVQSAASDTRAPLVEFTVTKRVEVDDSVTIHATDASGIGRMGFIVRQVGAATVMAGDSANFAGATQTDVTRTFALGRAGLGLDTVTTFPRLVTVEAFAIDGANNRGLSARDTTPVPATGVARLDTLTVVAGKTFPLPSGGQIADAIYNRTRNEVYFSNIQRDRIEVFNVLTSTFLAGGIPVGSRPWGLALWPRDTLGNYADTVIVANSGGTNLSIVDVAAQRELRRHRLPNYLVQKVRTRIDPATNGLKPDVTEFDFSDRPQFVATACRANCANVFAIYSTSPTPGNTDPYAGRGYVAWDELTATIAAPNGHFFWEHAAATASAQSDTLQLIAVRDTAPGFARRDTVLGAGVGIMANFDQIAFQESTFVRNSGDFNHALIGEGGGSILLARALAWDSRPGIFTILGTDTLCFTPTFLLKCDGILDAGISAGIFVRDFIANRASRVRSIATNFNGRTNFVRADSIYVFDFTLRQSGILQVGGANAGMDVHPLHAFDARDRGTNTIPGDGDADSRILFAARADASIDIFDSYFFGPVATPLPIRDPIVGPLRLARYSPPVGPPGQVLVGVTANGIVVVPLTTAITNPFPTRQASQLAPPRRTSRRGR